MKYRKKPVVIDAVRWDGDMHLVKKELGQTFQVFSKEKPDSLRIETLEGDHECRHGDYILKGVKGEFYPCKQDIFEMTYEKVIDKE